MVAHLAGEIEAFIWRPCHRHSGVKITEEIFSGTRFLLPSDYVTCSTKHSPSDWKQKRNGRETGQRISSWPKGPRTSQSQAVEAIGNCYHLSQDGKGDVGRGGVGDHLGHPADDETRHDEDGEGRQHFQHGQPLAQPLGQAGDSGCVGQGETASCANMPTEGWNGCAQVGITRLIGEETAESFHEVRTEAPVDWVDHRVRRSFGALGKRRREASIRTRMGNCGPMTRNRPQGSLSRIMGQSSMALLALGLEPGWSSFRQHQKLGVMGMEKRTRMVATTGTVSPIFLFGVRNWTNQTVEKPTDVTQVHFVKLENNVWNKEISVGCWSIYLENR